MEFHHFDLVYTKVDCAWGYGLNNLINLLINLLILLTFSYVRSISTIA